MTKHNYIAGKAYKMEIGEKAVFVGENAFNPTYPLVFAHELDKGKIYPYTIDGKFYFDGRPSNWNIIGEWPPEPKKVKGWVNVYKGQDYSAAVIFDSKEKADKQRHVPNRIACIPIEFTEGEGL